MIQEQKWDDYTMFLIVDEERHGSIMLEIPIEPRSSADAYLYNLYVDEPYRRMGVAKQLMETAENEARNRHCKTIALEWDRDEEKRWLLNFYEQSGYVEKIFGVHKTFMVKEL